MDLIERRQGSGTRVKHRETSGDQAWHFRFKSTVTGKSLPVLAARVQIEEFVEKGEWADFLDQSDSYICIKRDLQLSENVTAIAQMYLHPRTAPTLLDHNSVELTVVNIRAYLKEKNGVFPSQVSHAVSTVLAEDVPFGAASALHDGPWYEIFAKMLTSNRNPVYFQKIWAPVATCNLSFGHVY